MASVGTQTGRVIWHELLAPDVPQATRFYRELLGWETQTFKPEESDYPMIHQGGGAHGGFQRTHPDAGVDPHWLAYVRVDDPDQTAEQARTLGGSVRVQPLDVRDVGRLTVVVDPEGAEIAALAPSVERPPPQGLFVWDELRAADVDAAGRFYTGLFGWTARGASFDEDYTILASGAADVGAIARASGKLRGWLPYLVTNEIDDVMRRADDLGASTLMQITETAGVGRYAVIEDPAGAAAGLLEPAS